MSKYKKGFSPLEAALLAVGLEEYEQIPQTQQLPNSEPNELRLLASEAHEILAALNDETILAYQALNGEDNKTELSIYKEWYTDETQQGIDLANTKLTKESLALWFTNIGEEDKANKFVKPTSNKTLYHSINKFNKGFTPEHCALIATGLDSYNDIDTAIRVGEEQDELLQQQAIDAHRDFWYDVDTDPNLDNGLAMIAKNLREVLCDEIEIAYECYTYDQHAMEYAEIGEPQTPPSQRTDIEIYKLSFINNDLDIENTKITKSSLAIWLWKNGYKDFAINVQSNIADVIESNINNLQQGFNAQLTKSEKNSSSCIKPTSIRTSESSLIDSLGIMAWMLSKKSSQFKHGDKPNSKQIKEQVEKVINELNLNSEENKLEISNLNKDISFALKQLEGRFKL